jgi:hypothetical protein
MAPLMSILTVRQRSVLGILLCLCLIGIFSASSAEYEVDGQLEQTTYKRDGSVGTVHQYQFTVFVRDCAWLIRTTQNDTNGNPVFASETACVNGAEIYEVSGRIDNGALPPAGRGSRPSNVASIVSNNVPIGSVDRYFVGHIWLMYASGCYFQHRTNNDWLTPVYDINASADVQPYLKRKAQWELIDGPGSLPKSVAYDRDYNPDNIDAIYTATGITNVGSIKIPSGFVFEWKSGGVADFGAGGVMIYQDPTGPNQRASTNHLRKRVVGTVTAVRPYCSRKDLKPTAKGRTIVTDQRPFQELWSPTLPTNIPKWLVQVGLWDGNTNHAATLPTSIPPILFALHTPAPPTNRYYYVVQDGVQWLPLAKAKKAYYVGSQPPPAKPVSRGIIFAVLLLPTAVFASFWLLTRKRG